MPHDIRRTAVRNRERSGVSRSVATKLTGHRTEAVFGRYAIVSSPDLRDAVRRLENGYTHGYTEGSPEPARKPNAQKSSQHRTRRDGRVVDGGGLENH